MAQFLIMIMALNTDRTGHPSILVSSETWHEVIFSALDARCFVPMVVGDDRNRSQRAVFEARHGYKDPLTNNPEVPGIVLVDAYTLAIRYDGGGLDPLIAWMQESKGQAGGPDGCSTADRFWDAVWLVLGTSR